MKKQPDLLIPTSTAHQMISKELCLIALTAAAGLAAIPLYNYTIGEDPNALKQYAANSETIRHHNDTLQLLADGLVQGKIPLILEVKEKAVSLSNPDVNDQKILHNLAAHGNTTGQATKAQTLKIHILDNNGKLVCVGALDSRDFAKLRQGNTHRALIAKGEEAIEMIGQFCGKPPSEIKTMKQTLSIAAIAPSGVEPRGPYSVAADGRAVMGQIAAGPAESITKA